MANIDEKIVFDFSEYEDILNPLITEINTNLESSEDSFLSLGYKLANIENKLNKADKDLSKGTFTRLKEETAIRLSMKHHRNIDKVVRIAKNPTITSYRLEGGILPRSWTTLYHLTRLTKSKIEDLVESGLVTKETKRDEMIAHVDKKLGKVEKVTSNFQKLMITREVEGEATDAELKELKETLSKLKWKMKVDQTKKNPSIPVDDSAIDTPAKVAKSKLSKSKNTIAKLSEI